MNEFRVQFTQHHHKKNPKKLKNKQNKKRLARIIRPNSLVPFHIEPLWSRWKISLYSRERYGFNSHASQQTITITWKVRLTRSRRSHHTNRSIFPREIWVQSSNIPPNPFLFCLFVLFVMIIILLLSLYYDCIVLWLYCIMIALYYLCIVFSLLSVILCYFGLDHNIHTWYLILSCLFHWSLSKMTAATRSLSNYHYHQPISSINIIIHQYLSY